MGTGLPTSSPGLQLSQGLEKAVYQHTQPHSGMQSCSTPDPHCSPAGRTFPQRKPFVAVLNKSCKPTHRLACVPSAHRRISHCPQQSLTGRETPGQHFSPELPLPHRTNTAPASQVCWPAVSSPELQAVLHPTGQPRKQELQGKAPTSSSSPQDREAGKGGSSLRQFVLPPPPLLQQESPVTHGFASRGRTCQHITHQQKKPLPSHVTRMRPSCIKKRLTASQV